jgi:hypothetical protein
MFGGAFLARIGWEKSNLTNNVMMTSVVLTLLWVIVFSGNYAVLRDGMSVLPFVMAFVLFLSALFVSSGTREIKLPVWRGTSYHHKFRIGLFVLLAMLMIGLSDTHAWWGPVLQIFAVVFGAVLGRYTRLRISAVPGCVSVLFVVVVAMLMQPEFFRFGQLGNLSLFHLVSVLLFGLAVAGVFVLRNVNVRGALSRGVYIKLKWLLRLVCVLGMMLFIMTESVPVFLGLVVACIMNFALSVWHAHARFDDLVQKMIALVLMLFGFLTVMPVIVALGVVYWPNASKKRFGVQIRSLL